MIRYQLITVSDALLKLNQPKTAQNNHIISRLRKVDSDPVIIPYKVIDIGCITLYGIMNGSLSAYF